jgi:hypothetical protein
MNTSTQAFWCFGVDGAKAHEAPERRLNVAAGAAKPVIQIEVAEGGIEIVTPHQNHHAAAEPDAFRISGRAIDGLRSLDEFIGLALTVFGHISRRSRIGRGRLARLILGAKVAALGEGASETDQQCESGCGNATRNRILKLEHPLTHKVPDFAACLRHTLARPLMPFKWVPIAAETHRNPMADNLDFVQQSRNFIALLVKPPRQNSVVAHNLLLADGQ